jgi:hypothetical protein
VTGYHRKAALRRLHRPPRSTPRTARTGRPRVYGPDVTLAAQVLWEASGEIGAVRLQPFLPELLDRLLAFGALPLTPDTATALRRVSAATLKRLLAPIRATRPLRGRGMTRAGTWLKHQIPIRTFAEWDDARPGFLEGDLVAHCGPTTAGFYLFTLCAVDIVTAWTELHAVWGKHQERVGGAIHHVRQRLPMPLLGWDSDSGSEFINEAFWRYCQREGITFTRGRAGRKNDSAHVEQKNGAIVRRWIGDDRFTTKASYAALHAVYRLLRLHVNFFQPVQKVVAQTELPRPTDDGGREWVQYDVERFRLTELGRQALKTAHVVFAYDRRGKPSRTVTGKKILVPISIVRGKEFFDGSIEQTTKNMETFLTLHVLLDGTARRLGLRPEEGGDLELLDAACAAAKDPKAPWG